MNKINLALLPTSVKRDVELVKSCRARIQLCKRNLAFIDLKIIVLRNSQVTRQAEY